MKHLLQITSLVGLPLLLVVVVIYKIQNIERHVNLKDLQTEMVLKKHTVKDHSQFAELQKQFTNPHEVTAACLTCHKERGDELLKSPHFTWEREAFVEGKGVVYYGKKNGLNNFCTGIAGSEATCNRCHTGYGYDSKDFDFTNPNNIDCMACHDNSFTYEKAKGGAGYPVITPQTDWKNMFANIGSPKRENCGACHFHSAGGNNIKHGQLEMAQLDCSREVDVHMSQAGANHQCVDCHVTKNHVMQGRYYGVSFNDYNRATCAECHTDFPHKDDQINAHTLKIACQTCHIPTYAKVNPTKMYWDWSTACDLKDGNPYHQTDSQGNETYLSAKGSFVWQRNVQPDYVWFNGNADHHLLSDTITEVPVKINTLFGNYADSKAKIWPVKTHRGKQPYDTENNRIVQPKLWDAEPNKGALWVDYDWSMALEKGMKYKGLPYSGKHGFVETEMYLPLSHMVSPKEQSLTCVECHSSSNSRLAGLTDFYLPGRDRNDWVDFFGVFLLLSTLGGVLVHGSIRIIASMRAKK
jgi:octaheme c-type cytochrome (tetrathionate reductase family)